MSKTSLNRTVTVERIKEIDERKCWVREEVSPNLDEDFAIDENRLDYEMCRLGHLLASYGNLASELKAELARKEEYVKRSYAVAALSIRAQAKASGEKITDPGVKERVEADERQGSYQSDLQYTRLNALLAESWYQGIKKKADLVIALAYKQGREIKAYGDGSY